MVDWFSSCFKQYKNGRKGYLKWGWLFERFTRDEGQLHKAYKPITADATHAKENFMTNPQSQAAAAVIQKIEGEIERTSGFQSNSRIRKRVELHAMQCAETEFKQRGYAVNDKSAKHPYDLLCEKPDETKYVEVKGTQGDGFDVVLTAGEVKFIQKNQANCILCVVHGISVRGETAPRVSGGQVSVNEPFNLSEGKLSPIAFTFRRSK